MSDFFDNEAVFKTADELNMDTGDVVSSVKVYWVYERHHRSLKAKRENAKREAEEKKALELWKAREPNRCFCKEDGLEVQRYFEGENGGFEIRDRVIRTFTAYGPYDFYRANPYEEPIYECSRCGKEWIQEIAFA